MTDKEDEALTIFCRMVAEINDSQDMADLLKDSGDPTKQKIGRFLNGWLESLRAGNSQQYLNELAVEIVNQKEE